jgi:hypothetical protein
MKRRQNNPLCRPSKAGTDTRTDTLAKGAGFWAKGAGFWAKGAEFWTKGTGFYTVISPEP